MILVATMLCFFSYLFVMINEPIFLVLPETVPFSIILRCVILFLNAVPPVITQEVMDYYVKEGDDVKLGCQVDGNPKPVITWNKNGIVISPSLPRLVLSKNLHNLF